MRKKTNEKVGFLGNLLLFLAEFAQRFQPVFQLNNHNAAPKFSQYLAGLFPARKRNMERMVNEVPGSDWQQMQHFILECKRRMQAIKKMLSAADVREFLEALLPKRKTSIHELLRQMNYRRKARDNPMKNKLLPAVNPLD